MTLWKLPLLLIHSVATYIAITPPQPPPSKEETAKYTRPDTLNRILAWGPDVGKGIAWALNLCEAATILARAYPALPYSSAVLAKLTFGNPASAANLAISPVYVLGWALIVCGALLRKACYAYLGKQFTYRLAIVKGHTLVTDGPYALVRHPSYTGLIAFCVGMWVSQATPGSWTVECGVLQRRAGMALMGLWWVYIWSVPMMVPSRVRQEDEVLRKEFGEQWEEWQRKTPYGLIPGVV